MRSSGTDCQRSALIAAILVVAAMPRIWAAVWDQGIFWPDEIFQSTEQAHRFAFGYGFVSWEFEDGARSWLFPGAVGLFWKLLAVLGVSGAPTLVVSAKLIMVALALAGIYASMRVAEKLGGAEAAVLCGALAAVFPPSIVYGSRCMTEMASGPVLVIAVLLTLGTSRRQLVTAGCLAALAIYLRYQNGIVTVALLGLLLAQHRRSDALYYAAGAAVIGLAGGLLDLFTWGTPFHSFVAYVRFNLLEGRAAEFGVEPFAYYITVFGSAVGISILAVAIGLGECVARATGLVVVVLLYVLAHSLVAHKEFRFIMPIVPLMLSLSGVGLAVFLGRFLAKQNASLDASTPRGQRPRQREQRRNGSRGSVNESTETIVAPAQVREPIWVVAGILAVVMGSKTARVSFDDFGQRRGPLSGVQPLWHTVEPVNRLLWVVGGRSDLCGLALVGYDPIWTGGYTYLHRDVPMLWASPVNTRTQPGLRTVGAATNYVLAPAEFPLPEAYATIETIGATKLARRSGACAAPPAWYTRSFPKP